MQLFELPGLSWFLVTKIRKHFLSFPFSLRPSLSIAAFLVYTERLHPREDQRSEVRGICTTVKNQNTKSE